MKIKLRVDSRDSHFHKHFGSTVFYEPFKNFDDGSIPEKIQPIGNVECTCYTAEYIAQNFTKKEYDIDELFSQIPNDKNGADPRTVCNAVIKIGLLPKGGTVREKPFKAYSRADTGPYDAFDNCRSAMNISGMPIGIWTNWYQEWEYLGNNAVMPMGKTRVSAHMYANKGWAWIAERIVNGEPMFAIEWWGGYIMYMPREVFNSALKELGTGTVVFLTEETGSLFEKSLMETVIDWLQNLYLSLTIKKKDMNNLLWDTKENIRHSVRVLCDDEGLTVAQKNTLCATVEAESDFNLHAINYNYAFRLDGTKYVSSTDRGIAQWNDYWHGKEITPDEAFNNPEKCIRLMCTYWKNGQMKQWCAYSNGTFRRYL